MVRGYTLWIFVVVIIFFMKMNFCTTNTVSKVGVYECHCVLPVGSGAWVDCCRNIDLNGDGRMDLLVSCQLRSDHMLAYGELINVRDSFCVRRANKDFNNVCSGIPPCTD